MITDSPDLQRMETTSHLSTATVPPSSSGYVDDHPPKSQLNSHRRSLETPNEQIQCMQRRCLESKLLGLILTPLNLGFYPIFGRIISMWGCSNLVVADLFDEPRNCGGVFLSQYHGHLRYAKNYWWQTSTFCYIYIHIYIFIAIYIYTHCFIYIVTNYIRIQIKILSSPHPVGPSDYPITSPCFSQ